MAFKEDDKLSIDDFYDAIASHPVKDIIHYLAFAVCLGKDGDNFTNEESKWFIENVVKLITDSDIEKCQKQLDNEKE